MSGRYWDHRTCRWEGGDDPAGPPPVWSWPRVVPHDAVPAQPGVEDAEPLVAVAPSA